MVLTRLAAELLQLGDSPGHGLTIPRVVFRPSPTRARIPDFVFIAKVKLPIPRESRDVPVVPDLIIELLSSETVVRDLRDKRDDYRAAGVPGCWIVDPEGRSVTVWDFTAQPPTAVEYRGRLPWMFGGQRLGEIELPMLFATEGWLR